MRESRACEITRLSEYLYEFSWRGHKWQTVRRREDTNESYWLVQEQKKFWADVDAAAFLEHELQLGESKVMFETKDFRDRQETQREYRRAGCPT